MKTLAAFFVGTVAGSLGFAALLAKSFARQTDRCIVCRARIASFFEARKGGHVTCKAIFTAAQAAAPDVVS